MLGGLLVLEYVYGIHQGLLGILDSVRLLEVDRVKMVRYCG